MYVKKFFIIFSLLFSLSGCQSTKKTDQVCFKNNCIDVEIVYKKEERQRGLQFRKSLGKNKGFRCDKCRERYLDKKREEKVVKRTVEKGLYITSARSQRHLTKPYRRYGLEKNCKEKILMIDKWHG